MINSIASFLNKQFETAQPSAEISSFPEEFICPIDQTPFKDPVQVIHKPEGKVRQACHSLLQKVSKSYVPEDKNNVAHIFERSAIQDWLAAHQTCPTCRREIENRFQSVSDLKKRVETFQQEHPEASLLDSLESFQKAIEKWGWVGHFARFKQLSDQEGERFEYTGSGIDHLVQEREIFYAGNEKPSLADRFRLTIVKKANGEEERIVKKLSIPHLFFWHRTRPVRSLLKRAAIVQAALLALSYMNSFKDSSEGAFKRAWLKVNFLTHLPLVLAEVSLKLCKDPRAIL